MVFWWSGMPNCDILTKSWHTCSYIQPNQGPPVPLGSLADKKSQGPWLTWYTILYILNLCSQYQSKWKITFFPERGRFCSDKSPGSHHTCLCNRVCGDRSTKSHYVNASLGHFWGSKISRLWRSFSREPHHRFPKMAQWTRWFIWTKSLSFWKKCDFSFRLVLAAEVYYVQNGISCQPVKAEYRNSQVNFSSKYHK